MPTSNAAAPKPENIRVGRIRANPENSPSSHRYADKGRITTNPLSIRSYDGRRNSVCPRNRAPEATAKQKPLAKAADAAWLLAGCAPGKPMAQENATADIVVNKGLSSRTPAASSTAPIRSEAQM